MTPPYRGKHRRTTDDEQAQAPEGSAPRAPETAPEDASGDPSEGESGLTARSAPGSR